MKLFLFILLLPCFAHPWEIIPSSSGICANGGSYKFAQRSGDKDKLWIDFAGGGACWDEITCALPIYTDFVSPSLTLLELNAKHAGIHSMKSPFRNWTAYHLPYCTGDAHLGNSSRRYSDKLTVEHRGKANVLSVLEKIKKETKENPKVVLTTGCSAGSLGAIGWMPFIIELFPESKHYSWFDSYVGVLSKDQFEGGKKNWPLLLFDDIVPELKNLTFTEDIGERIVSSTIAHFPNVTFADYTSDYDIVQTTFFTIGGGKGRNWHKMMRKMVSNLYSRHLNFYYWISDRISHCVSGYDLFFRIRGEEKEGKEEKEGWEGGLSNWVEDMVNGKDIPRKISPSS